MHSTRATRRRRRLAGLVASAAVAGGLVATGSPAQATELGYSCIAPLESFDVGGVQNRSELIDYLKLKLERDGQPLTYTGGQPLELDDLSLTVRIDDEAQLKRIWEGANDKPLIPDVGTTTWPLWVWVAIKGTNTQEGVQVVQARASYDFTVKDPTPGTYVQPGTFRDPGDNLVAGNFGSLISASSPLAYLLDAGVRVSGDEEIAPIEAKVLLPKLKWTPTGAGDVQFSLGDPGDLGVIEVLARYAGRGRAIASGNGGDANRWHRVRPFGSVYVRAETINYGMSNDCVYGNITVADPSVPLTGNSYFQGTPASQNLSQRRSFFGNGSPTQPNFDLGPADAVGPPPGSPQGTAGAERAYAPLGVAGRYSIQQQATPVIATASQAQTPPEVVALQERIAQLNAQLAAANAAPPTNSLSVATSRARLSAGAVTIQFNNSASVAVVANARAQSASRVRVGSARRIIPAVLAADVLVPANGQRRIRLNLTPGAQQQIRSTGSLRVRLSVRPTGGPAVTRVVTITRR